MSDDPRHLLARRTEARVAAIYEERGFQIVGTNVRVGRLELDVVARRGAAIAICEVRARRAGGLLHPAETVDRKKLQRVRQAAAGFLRDRSVPARTVQIDVASVLVHPGGRLEVEIYENVTA